ncbi:DUF262 domain-containing protein [Thermococcus sp. AM4]|uniref:GmrSD restriction endonuclease domain-containing protein n=1 Tax=Thermococcus sp. (strain AM4) TaxID=246969 RepID=UPI000229986B|nr:DUF262 domain-containing protein [Thermococcus sp. AM4]EEB74516.2 conserved hypothetical protein [Thermococcus sp. AM4]
MARRRDFNFDNPTIVFSRLEIDSIVDVDNVNLTVHELVQKYDNGKLIIPKIQRGFVWDRNRGLLFLMSLIQNYPLPPLFLFQIGDEYYVLDGQQRLKTILWFIKNGKIDDPVVNKRLGSPRLTPDIVKQLVKDTGLELREEDVRKAFSKNNHNHLRNWILDKPIPVTTIKFRGTRDDIDTIKNLISDIFIRINRGSMRLNEFDMIRALHYKDAKEYLDAIESIIDENFPILPDEAELNYEQYIRIEKALILIEYFLNGFKVRTDFEPSNTNKINDVIEWILKDRAQFLRRTPSEAKNMINTFKEQISETIERAYEMFGEDAFRKPKVGRDCRGNVKCAALTFNYKQYSPLIFVFEVLAIKLAMDNNEELIYGNRVEEFKHEIIVRALTDLDKISSRTLGDFEIALKVARELVLDLSNDISKTFYERSPSELKQLLWDKFKEAKSGNPYCPYCKAEIKQLNTCDLAHIVPYKKTRTSSIFNVVLAHRKCNRRNKDKVIEELL